jgi:agmatinase
MNFGGIPRRYSGEKNAKVVVIPVPYDGTSTWVKGADKGPAALIEASANMELYDIEKGIEFYTCGIFTEKPVTEKRSPEKMSDAVESIVTKHLKNGKYPALIGGEHSVSIGAIRAMHKKYKKLTVLQLDAHGDTREKYEGSACNHACVMARARELGKIVQVGIRSLCIEESETIDNSRVFYAHSIYNHNNWIKKAIDLISENVYITIDLDVFDPSVMPSTGTPEPGGMGWYQVLEFLEEVHKHRNVTGFDVVELCPDKRNKAPDFLAAKLAYKMIGYKYFNHEKSSKRKKG